MECLHAALVPSVGSGQTVSIARSPTLAQTTPSPIVVNDEWRVEQFYWCGDLSFPVSAAGQPEPEPKRFHSDQFFGDVAMLMSQEEEEQSVRRCLSRQQPGGCEQLGHSAARENAFA